MFKPIILSITLGCASLVALPAVADTVKDRIIVELKEQGFQQITISRTFLGRTRIVAVSPGRQREVILNGSNGVVLRDYLKETPEDDGDNGHNNAGNNDNGAAQGGQTQASQPGGDSAGGSATATSSDDSKSGESSSDKNSSDSSDDSHSSDDSSSDSSSSDSSDSSSSDSSSSDSSSSDSSDD